MPRFSPRPVHALETRTTPDAGVALSGVVFTDLNGNGTLDAGETGLSDVTVRLDLAGNGTADDLATTAADGSFTFANVVSGVHAVMVVPPSGTTASGPATRMVTVGSADVGGLNLGLRPIGKVSGTVFADLNGNGKRDAGEQGIAGVSVMLDVNSDGN